MTHTIEKKPGPRPFFSLSFYARQLGQLALLALSIGVAGANADLQAGMVAYSAGDYVGAADAWHRLALDGDAGSQYRLAELYEEGMGVPQNGPRAAYWYRKAAEQGHLEAQFRLAVLLEFGRGVPADIFKSVEWYLKAAESGHPVACARTAAFYELIGDYVQAYLWYRVAMDNGHTNAKYLIHEVQNRLTRDTLELLDSGQIERHGKVPVNQLKKIRGL